ncbi:heterokaryon incompatibility Het-C, partial [Fistulina hepatica ATCC 64428]
AGDIPDFAYLNGKAFRHGDIEGSLENLVKYVGSASLASGFGSSSFFGFAKHVVQQATAGGQGPRFSPTDVKRVYFGNWLRDFSQACDIAGLSKLAIDSIVLLVAVLGFVDFGFATEEFQVTKERLGVYLTVEHIDNPKGYAKDEENEDARKYDPRLRPPVNPRELDIDGNTGMKKYMATEGENWDTSTACIRRNLIKAIELGRNADGGRTQGATLWEAYRLLGTGMHTLEDLLAHSNWCELALRKMGREEVFCHVGDEVLVTTPSGERVPPLVTGTFGGADFMHSMLGEATDKLSQSSVTELKAKMDDAKNNEGNNALALKAIISKLNLGGGDKMGKAEEIHEQSKAYNFNPDNIAPPEVQHQFLELLRWRDDIYREVLTKLEIIPGLMDLVNELSNALTAYVYAILAPYISPLLERATAILGDGSKAVIDSEDQYEVFDNPSASDPSHSLLSKDHFGIILNEPAGLIAMVVVENTVNLVVQAWNNNEDPHNVVNKILEAFHHPYYATGESSIQHNMFDTMQKWFGGLGGDEGAKVISQLTKESVRRGNNKRAGTESSDSSHVHGPSSYNYGKSSDSQGNYTSAAATQYGGEQSQESYNSSGDYKQTYGGDSGDFYGSSRASYGSSNQTYGSSDQSYDRSNNVYDSSPNSHVSSRNTYASVGDSRDTNYSSSRRDEQDLYGSGRNEYSSGPDKYSSSGYADRYQPSYSRPEPSYDDTQSGYSRGE